MSEEDASHDWKVSFQTFFLKKGLYFKYIYMQNVGIWNRENKAIFITFSKNVYGGFRCLSCVITDKLLHKKTEIY